MKIIEATLHDELEFVTAEGLWPDFRMADELKEQLVINAMTTGEAPSLVDVAVGAKGQFAWNIDGELYEPEPGADPTDWMDGYACSYRVQLEPAEADEVLREAVELLLTQKPKKNRRSTKSAGSQKKRRR